MCCSASAWPRPRLWSSPASSHWTFLLSHSRYLLSMQQMCLDLRCLWMSNQQCPSNNIPSAAFYTYKFISKNITTYHTCQYTASYSDTDSNKTKPILICNHLRLTNLSHNNQSHKTGFSQCKLHCESEKLGPFIWASLWQKLSDFNNSITVADRNYLPTNT